MRRWSFRGVLTLWALGLVAAAVAATAALSWAQMARLAREEAVARAERAAERGLAAAARGLDPAIFETGTGVEVVVRSRAEIERAFADDRVPLWREALEASSAHGYLADAGAVAARALPGAPAPGLVEARIPAAAVAATLDRFLAGAALTTGALLALTVLVSVAVARRLGAPLDALASAARRIGAGDLEQPVPELGPAETGRLAAALERTRVQLAQAGAERARRGAELEALVAGIAEGVVAVDRDRRIRFASPRAAALLGTTPAALAGRFCGDALEPRLEGGVRPCVEACPILHARFRGPARAVEALEPAGAPARSLVVSASPPSDGLQVLILREETPVESARRARDAAVADLAHELQTPLAAQHASLELLRARVADTDRAALDLVLALEAGTARLRRLIDNLLESVRIESGQLAIRRVEVDVEEVVEEAVAMTRPLLERRGQRLELDLPHPLPALAGDPQRLGQVLVNLLANASKYGPEGSAIGLGATVLPGRLALWVEDRGPGFPETGATAGRFRRGAAEPRQEGSGLGLWICRSILERHGGELALERADGLTRVRAELPTAEGAA